MGRLSIQDGIAIGKGKGLFTALLVHGASVVDEGDELPSEADREVLCTAALSGLDQIDRGRSFMADSSLTLARNRSISPGKIFPMRSSILF